MSHQVIIPSFGDSITNSSIGQWHVADGDTVSKGQTLVTLESDKVSQEVEAEVSGTIKILLAEEEEADIGAVIAEITAGAASEEASSSPAPAPAATVEESTPEVSGEPVPLTIPSFGDSINSASIGTWNFSEGDTVNKGDILVVLESDKVSSELEAPESGTLSIALGEGEEAEIGAVLGSILPGAGSAPAATPAPATASSEPAVAAPAPKPAKPAPAATPAVINEEGRTTRKKMSMLRRKISQHLVNAQHTAAILTTFNEVDMTAVMELRKSVQETFVAKHGVKLGFMSFFVKAVINQRTRCSSSS